MRIGSLFSGAGGLDLAALELFDGAGMAWHSDIDPAASKVLAHHWPDVVNLGDVTEIDWAAVEPVDVITGGFPCQDVSLAGARRGLREGTRSGLWAHMATAIDVLRPQYVLVENVRGLLSAEAHRAVESEPDDLGDGEVRPVLRALGAVLGDLADLGFDAEWTMLRASDVGFCHHRARVFILAYPADAGHDGREGRPEPDSEPQPRLHRPLGRHTDGRGDDAVALLPTPRASDGTNGGPNQRGSSGDLMLPSAVMSMLPTPTRSDGDRGDCPSERARRSPGLVSIDHLLPTPNASDGSGGGQHPDRREGHSQQLIDYALTHGTSRWGDYEAAIRRQESLTRPAPSPTEPNAKGNQRLSAAFAEWMMGWPSGWVTSPVLGISRADQLKIVGNGVVPQQAVAAFGQSLARISMGAAS